MTSQETVTTEAQVNTAIQPLTPPPSGDVVPYERADAPDRGRIEALLKDIDPADTASIISFGAEAQGELRDITGQMLEGVRNKDTGPAGAALNEVVTSVRGFDVSDLGEKPNIFQRLFGAAKPIAKFFQRYETVKRQIHALRSRLDEHKDQLMRDIIMLDKLYAASLNYFHELELYIAAGEERIKRMDEVDIPAKRKEVEGEDPLVAQELQRLIAARNDLERKVHDLKLTRQVTMQSLPSINLVQENDKSLITKIDSTVVNTIPLWEIQIAQAVTIHRSREAGKTVRAANDLTNELLEANAANLKQANAEIRREIERGVFDIESVKKANADLIATIEESIQIAEEGKRQRAAAEKELVACEAELKKALTSAR